MWNRKFECLSRSELDELQLLGLKHTVSRVYEAVPFYRQRFAQIGLQPQDISSLNDLKRMPFTAKADLRDNYPFGFFASPLQDLRRIHASSGTQGKPTIVGYTQADLDIWAEVVSRSLVACGVQAADILHNSYGYGLFTGGLGVQLGADRLGATVVPASGGRTRQQVTLLADCGSRVLCCTPSYALNIAYTMQDMGIKKQDLKLEIGILGAEPWTEALRKLIEERLGLKAFDIYGLSEILGPGVACECQVRSGLHLWEDYFLVEVINPQTKERVPYDTEGELVITTLGKEALPLLRYRTGDIAALISEPCPCGRTSRRISRIRSRLDDMLIIHGVNIYPSEIESALLSFQELSPKYQIVVKRQRALEVLSVQVEISEQAGSNLGGSTSGDLENLRQKAALLLRDSLGVSIAVELLPPGTLPFSEGKAIRIVEAGQEPGLDGARRISKVT